jgi:hypothetical protein
MKTKGILVLIFIACILVPSFANAEKLTGGGERAWCCPWGPDLFSVSANAIRTPEGRVKGHIQYSCTGQPMSPDLIVHAYVKCFNVSADGLVAVAAGPANASLDPTNYTLGKWLVIAVKEGGTGFGDKVRVIALDEEEAIEYCTNIRTDDSYFPGRVEEGNFTIHP